ncbi:MAG: dihydrolipoamide acetyltransferase family protein [Bacteroidales bacterium]|nr:2-oxo acid dehydrogenase subunit E2 [Bacteroidales bacterium]MDD3010893.1 dihydrolipoamide acetyltransferase family protein [Bacteroidales bacterium]MDD3960461.1 dihydrolipoamide acetyltransferase family protein [Bacteroidales bacterium]HPE86141.1 dihydrolipoamide acetyltransferase family protein [Bacteroidales bacterium]
MAKHEIVIPKMGESIIEATITKWLKKEGDRIAEEDPLVELATDKVDSEIPSPVDGKIIKILFREGDVVPVGKVIAILEIEGEEAQPEAKKAEDVTQRTEKSKTPIPPHSENIEQPQNVPATYDDRFYSPLVKSIARQEQITPAELATIKGTGNNNRVTKNDVMEYLAGRSGNTESQKQETHPDSPMQTTSQQATGPAITTSAGDEIIQMDRMRKLIADHMVHSVHTSPHVTSFIEVDMEPVVQWRNLHKEDFLRKEKQKLTFTPFFIEAAARALRDFPGVNASVDGDKIILRRNINIGMAAALPNGNLIVPVIRNADKMNLAGIATAVNDLAERARNNKLKPDEIQEGSFTVTNLGTFGSVSGTPIINQPQVAILGIGVIEKKPVVAETPLGDTLAIRHRCMLSLAYDHRVVDGALGGMFLQRIAQYLENFDSKRTV